MVFGMKAHIGTDLQGLVHSVAVTPANAHDATLMDECLHGQGEGDLWRQGLRERAAKGSGGSTGVEWRVLRKATRKRKLTVQTNPSTKRSNRTRAKVEHPSG